MKFGILVFPGTWSDRDCQHALAHVLGEEAVYIWHQDEDLQGCDCVILPGGFSYGDYLRTGAIARFSPVMAGIQAFAQEGGLVLGICNGFQVLLEAGLLPGAMLRNASVQFRSEWVWCRVERNDTPFTRGYQVGQVLRLPIAHGEGNYVCPSQPAGTVLRYCDAEGNVADAANPNGSQDNIAGIANESGTVFGLMPHPERAAEALLGSADAQCLFASLALALG